MFKKLLSKLGLFFKKEVVKEVELSDFIEPKKEIKCHLCDTNQEWYLHLNGKYIDNVRSIKHLDGYNPLLKNIIIIDDNKGMINFLKVDIEQMMQTGEIPKVNIFLFDTPYAVFELEVFLLENPNIKFDYAIIDITYGGRRLGSDGRNIVYTGIDALRLIHGTNKDLKYLLFTGNNLNRSIKANDILIKKYIEENDRNIEDVLLFKTSVTLDGRREEIKKRLFNE